MNSDVVVEPWQPGILLPQIVFPLVVAVVVVVVVAVGVVVAVAVVVSAAVLEEEEQVPQVFLSMVVVVQPQGCLPGRQLEVLLDHLPVSNPGLSISLIALSEAETWN